MERQQWTIATTEEFQEWFQSLNHQERAKVTAGVEVLKQFGPGLGRPHVDTLKDSQHKNLKELRATTKTSELRTFFAFDPEKTGILLVGGDKQGENQKRWYRKMIAVADLLYDQHLEDLDKRKKEK